MLATYDGHGSTAEKLTSEEIAAMNNKKPKLEVIKGGEDNENEENAKQKREQKAQQQKEDDDDLEELNFLLSVNKPQDTAKRIVHLADKALKKRTADENLAAKEQAEAAELAQFENQLNKNATESGHSIIETLNKNLGAEQKSQSNEIDLTDQAELMELTEKPETAIETDADETKNYNDNVIDFVQKQLGQKSAKEIEQNLISYLIQQENNNPRGEFANAELRADLKKLGVELPTEAVLNKSLQKMDTSQAVAEKFLNQTDEGIADEENDFEEDRNWIEEQNKKIKELSKNDQLNLGTLRDLRNNNGNNHKLFINVLNGLTKNEQERIIPLLTSEERQYNQEPWVINWVNSSERKFSPEPTRWQKIKNFFGRS